MTTLLLLLLGVPACETEDVTAVACVWDASHQGNGIGQDFLALPNGLTIHLP